MNSIFKRSKLDEMQEIKQLKIEHYGYWVLYGGLVVSIVVQAAQDAPLAQYLPEGILLVGTSAVMLGGQPLVRAVGPHLSAFGGHQRHDGADRGGHRRRHEL